MKKKLISISITISILTAIMGAGWFTIDTYDIYKNGDIENPQYCYIENSGEIGYLKCSIAYLLKYTDKINELKVK